MIGNYKLKFTFYNTCMAFFEQMNISSVLHILDNEDFTHILLHWNESLSSNNRTI